MGGALLFVLRQMKLIQPELYLLVDPQKDLHRLARGKRLLIGEAEYVWLLEKSVVLSGPGSVFLDKLPEIEILEVGLPL